MLGEELLECVSALEKIYPLLYGFWEDKSSEKLVYLVFRTRDESFDRNKCIARFYCFDMSAKMELQKQLIEDYMGPPPDYDD